MHKFVAIFAMALILFQAGDLSCLAVETSVIEVSGCECGKALTHDIELDAAGCQMDCQCPCHPGLSFPLESGLIRPGESCFLSVLTAPVNLKMVSTSVFQPPKTSL